MVIISPVPFIDYIDYITNRYLCKGKRNSDSSPKGHRFFYAPLSALSQPSQAPVQGAKTALNSSVVLLHKKFMPLAPGLMNLGTPKAGVEKSTPASALERESIKSM